MRTKKQLLAAVTSALTCLSLNAHAGLLSRSTADFLNFDGSETATSITAAADCTVTPCVPGSPDGALFYRKMVTVPTKDNVLYVTFSGTADVHDDAALMVSCRADGDFCNPGPQGASAGPAGWVTLQKLPFDRHDNSIKATWCIPLEGMKSKTEVLVDLKLASSTGGTVFFENAHIYVDSSRNNSENRCQAFALLAKDVASGEVKADTVKRHQK